MSYANVGKVWSTSQLPSYIKKLKAPKWAKGVCIHHTAFPNLEMRPKGMLAQHIENIRFGYSKEKGWRSGPHFFTDEDQVWGMTPPTEFGIHAVGFNRSMIGIEALGDFDSESPLSGRGLQVMQTTAATTGVILNWLGLPINASTIVFHRDDGYTNKTCPGRLVEKEWFVSMVSLSNNFPVATQEPLVTKTAPVYDWLINKGMSGKRIRAGLKRTGTLVTFEGKWLEGAFYDSKIQSTVSPISELEEIPI